MPSGFYCVDYVVINYHERNPLRFEWKGTPLHADPDAALAPGGHSKDSFVNAVSYYADPARGPDDRELRYGAGPAALVQRGGLRSIWVREVRPDGEPSRGPSLSG
jgi:hypothetical protein